jgi:4-hydroxy-2-oxoheptanedioate aldolase
MEGFRRLIQQEKPTIGGWCSLPGGFTAEVMANSGFDWACIDLQHGMITSADLLPMLQAFATTHTPVAVRVGWNDPSKIMKALDSGAQAVIVPLVDTPDQARAAVRACRYPPLGIRSWGPTRSRLGVPNLTPATADKATVLLVMLETENAVARLPEILDTEGVDGIFVGPNDLALTNGRSLPRDASPEELAQQEGQIQIIIETAQAHGKIAGINCASVEVARKRAEQGFRLLAISSDIAFLVAGGRQVVTALGSTAS